MQEDQREYVQGACTIFTMNSLHTITCKIGETETTSLKVNYREGGEGMAHTRVGSINTCTENISLYDEAMLGSRCPGSTVEENKRARGVSGGNRV